MSNFLNNCKPINGFNGGKLIGLYGRGSTGKTTISASFPKPIFFIFDDQGLNSIKRDIPDAPYLDVSGFSSKDLIALLDEIGQINDGEDRTYIFSTFSVWIDGHATALMKEKGKSHMSQDLWGEHNTRVNQVIAKCSEVARTGKRIILEFHERTSIIEGFEDELTPEIGLNAGPSIQKYLVGMLNYAFHTSIKQIKNPSNPNESYNCYTLDINPLNPYYWIKAQGLDNTKAPSYLVVDRKNAYNQIKEYFPEI